MTDNREIARGLLSQARMNLGYFDPYSTEGHAIVAMFAAALDAATERGRMQGWSAEARTTLEWIEQRCNDGSNDILADRETIHAVGRKARAAIAAIPAPPDLIECPKCRTLRSAEHHASHVCD